MKKLPLAASICALLITLPAAVGQTTGSIKKNIAGFRSANMNRPNKENDVNSLLNGISEMSVDISMPPFSLQDAIDQHKIKTLIEEHLKRNGIVVESRLGLHKKHSAMLAVSMSQLAGPKDGSSAFVLRAEVLAEVRPIQNSRNYFLARLYAYERLEHVGLWNLNQQDFEADVLDCVNHVIDEWKPSNAKPSGSVRKERSF